MSKVSIIEVHYELGYRDASGEEWWGVDHGDNDIWIPWNSDAGLPEIDIYGRDSDIGNIRQILDARGYNDWPALMRRVETTYYEAEEVA